MKTRRKRMTGPVMIGLMMLPCALHAQVTLESNTITGTEYVGCDANSNQPLRFSTLANFRHEWRTNNVFRMRLTQTLTGQTINGFGGLDLSGHLGVGPFSGNVNRPFSMIHIDNGGNQVSGFRPWLKTGLTLTRGTDLGYVGLKDEGDDLIHMTVCWADNTLVQGPDLLKFIFLAQPILANGTAGTLNGLEAARICPAPDGNESFYGIGDWFTTGGNVNPDERLDILDGRVRIRQLPNDDEEPTEDKVMVVDDDGVVKWRSATGIVGAGDCKWTMSGGANNKNVWTAIGTGTSCPNQENRVGIGLNIPAAKLDVLATANSGSVTALRAYQQSLSGVTHAVRAMNIPLSGFNTNTGHGVFATAENASTLYGVRAESKVGSGQSGVNTLWGVFGSSTSVSDATHVGGIYGGATAGNSTQITNLQGGNLRVEMHSNSVSTAVYGLVAKVVSVGSGSTAGKGTTVHGGSFEAIRGTGTTYGVESSANSGGGNDSYGVYAAGYGATITNTGVRGRASGSGTTNYGVYGSATGGGGATNWGGYFEGEGFLGASEWTYSDAALKTNISDLDPAEALDIITQLGAKRYNFNTDAHPYLSLPTQGQIGLISQEVEAFLPELVKDVQRPAAYDSTGVEVEPAMTFKAMNYNALIPVLIAAIQEQQTQADAMQDQLAAMQEALASCCTPSDDGSLMEQPLDSEGEPKIDPALERLLRIDPNPFTEATTLRYTLERAGRAQLLVNSSDGKQLKVLHEGLAPAGDHSYDWNTSHLAAGMYYVTLLLDGEPLVKRAVKVR